MSKVNKTIQEKTAELNEIVAWFHSDEFTLETALDTFKRAEKLAEEIEQDLLSLQNDIRVVKARFDEDASA